MFKEDTEETEDTGGNHAEDGGDTSREIEKDNNINELSDEELCELLSRATGARIPWQEIAKALAELG